MKVKLSEVIDGMEDQTDEAGFYLDKTTGEVIWAVNEDGEDETEKYEDDDNYIPLPDKFDIHEYKIMEAFCLSREDETIRDKLLNAIRGKGAFRYFKDLIFEVDVREDWYKVKQEAFKKIAIEWCDDNNIEYIE